MERSVRVIEGPAAVVLGVALLGAAVVIGILAFGVPLCGTSGTGPWCMPSLVTGAVLFLGGVGLLVVGLRGGAELGTLYLLSLMIAGILLLIGGLSPVGVSLLGVAGGFASSIRFILIGLGAVLLLVPFSMRNRKTTVST